MQRVRHRYEQLSVVEALQRGEPPDMATTLGSGPLARVGGAARETGDLGSLGRGVNAEFVDTTDQSCLNRFVTTADWDPRRLNAERLALLQEDPETRYDQRGVIAIGDVLIDHDGKLIEDVGWFWDHAEDRHKIAHDYLLANYVCPSGKHYPLEFRR